MIVLITLAISGTLFLAFGLFLFFSPASIDLAKVIAEHPTALTEIRSFYGGLEIGLGLFLLYALRDDSLGFRAIMLAALDLCGIVLGRFLGAFLDGISGSYLYYALAMELPACLLALYSLYSLKQGSV